MSRSSSAMGEIDLFSDLFLDLFSHNISLFPTKTHLSMIKTGPKLHSTHIWYIHYLQLLSKRVNTPSSSNPHILCAGNQGRGTLNFTRMQFFLASTTFWISKMYAQCQFWIIASRLFKIKAKKNTQLQVTVPSLFKILA